MTENSCLQMINLLELIAGLLRESMCHSVENCGSFSASHRAVAVMSLVLPLWGSDVLIRHYGQRP